MDSVSVLDKAPDDRDLLEILDREGTSAFLRLRNIQKWSDDPKVNAQAKKEVEDLIEDRRFAETLYRVALADGIMDCVRYWDPPEASTR